MWTALRAAKENTIMERDSEGYIISRLPNAAKKYKKYEHLIIPIKDGFPEYTPEAFNCVNAFFKKQNLPFDIDNLNNQEWCKLSNGLKITDIEGLCKISYPPKSETVKENLVSFIKETIEEALPEDYKPQIENETILDICLTTNDGKLHIELPYCTIDKIVRITNE